MGHRCVWWLIIFGVRFLFLQCSARLAGSASHSFALVLPRAEPDPDTATDERYADTQACSPLQHPRA
jgi:hypothetical protein